MEIESRLFVGSALYPSPSVMAESVKASDADIITIALRRQNPKDKSGAAFWEIIKSLGIRILPNTAGCKTVREAVTTAMMARELFGTNWIKLEVIADDYTLAPEPEGLVEAAQTLVADGFEVFPYMTDELKLAEKLSKAGCRILMPWAAPIGSGQGVVRRSSLLEMREAFPDATLVVDAGIGKPSEAALVMEMGYDAVLVNSAIALSRDPVAMARAFKDAVRAGREGYESGFMPVREMASPSTPTLGTPFWHQDQQ